MSGRSKLLIALSVVTVVMIATSVWVYQAWSQAGTLVIDVRERGADGTNISLEVPGILIPAVIHFVPDQAFQFCEETEELRYAMPIILAAVDELQRIEDGILVTVESGDEFVQIEKINYSIVITVETDEESVHISVPLSGIKAVCKKMDRIVARAGEEEIL